MTRVSTLNVGIEAFTHVSHGEVETDFPNDFSYCRMGKPSLLIWKNCMT